MSDIFKCIQSQDEEEFWCKHDGSKHSIYCPLHPLNRLAYEQKDMPPEFQKLVDEHFWELI